MFEARLRWAPRMFWSLPQLDGSAASVISEELRRVPFQCDLLTVQCNSACTLNEVIAKRGKREEKAYACTRTSKDWVSFLDEKQPETNAAEERESEKNQEWNKNRVEDIDGPNGRYPGPWHWWRRPWP